LCVSIFLLQKYGLKYSPHSLQGSFRLVLCPSFSWVDLPPPPLRLSISTEVPPVFCPNWRDFLFDLVLPQCHYLVCDAYFFFILLFDFSHPYLMTICLFQEEPFLSAGLCCIYKDDLFRLLCLLSYVLLSTVPPPS